MTIFNEYARYYDLLNKGKDYEEEVRFITGLIRKYGKEPVNEILNLGCGTGNHDFIFAENGFSTTGIDLSEEMISIANEKVSSFSNKEKLTFLTKSISDFRRSNPYDVVISLFHVASYQVSNYDLENFFITAKENLRKGGVFIFDFWYGPAVLTDPPYVRVRRAEDEEIAVTRIAEPVLFPNENRVEIHFDVMVEAKESGKVKRFPEIHNMRYLFLPELQSLASLNGFEILSATKWLSEKEALDITSWYGIMILRKI